MCLLREVLILARWSVDGIRNAHHAVTDMVALLLSARLITKEDLEGTVDMLVCWSRWPWNHIRNHHISSMCRYLLL